MKYAYKILSIVFLNIFFILNLTMFGVYGSSDYEFEIEIDHNFNSGNLDCELLVDDNSEENFYFDSKSTSDELNIKGDFEEKIFFNCNRVFDEVELKVYDDSGKKIAGIIYEEEDEFEYVLNEKEYEFLIDISDNFEKENDCDLYLDSAKEESFTFDAYSKKSDLRLEYYFSEDFEINCDNKINKFSIFIYESDSGKTVSDYNLVNVSEVKFDIDDSKEVKPTSNSVQVVDFNTNIQEKTEEKTVSLVNTNTQINSSNSLNNINLDENNQNSDAFLMNRSGIESVNEAIENPKQKSFFFWVTLMIGVVVLLIYIFFKLGYIEIEKSDVYSRNNKPKKSKTPTKSLYDDKKHNVDMSFLGKKDSSRFDNRNKKI